MLSFVLSTSIEGTGWRTLLGLTCNFLGLEVTAFCFVTSIELLVDFETALSRLCFKPIKEKEIEKIPLHWIHGKKKWYKKQRNLF